MHVTRMATIHNRPLANARSGTEITNPDIDFGKLAQGMGVWGEGAKGRLAIRRNLAPHYSAQ